MAAESPEQVVRTPEPKTPPESLAASPDKDFVELPAPDGWKKKLAPLKKGGTPKRRDVIFVSPDGEEIKTRKQLERHLKNHPGGPPFSEFDWSSGETPRRSVRLSSKMKPSTESPEGQSGGKRVKRKVVKAAEPMDDEETKEKPEEPVPPTVEGKEEVIEDVQEVAGETENITVEANGDEKGEKKDEQVAKVVPGEPAEGVEVAQKESEEKEQPAGENFEFNEIGNKVVLTEGGAEKVGEADIDNGSVSLVESSQQKIKDEVVQQAGLDLEKSPSMHPETGASQLTDLQNSSELVGA